MNFFITKNSDFIVLKFPLTWKLRKQFDISSEMLKNVAVTFSMVESETGNFRIANASGELLVNDNIEDDLNFDEVKYSASYCFTLKDTRKAGLFIGEFVVDFFDDEFNVLKLKLPITDVINIQINDTITNTEVM